MVWETKRYADYVKKLIFHRNRLNFLILYLTSKCNLTCRSCFFHKNLNQSDDLSLAEYEKISRSLNNFSILGIGGGEPFMRRDLVDICALFVERNKIDTIFIPTNGVFTELILVKTEELLKRFPGVSLAINPSLDGLAEYHDNNRGALGTFDACVRTIKDLSKLKKKYANLQIIVNSVMMRDNLAELIKLMEYLKQFKIDWQAFEIIRGDWRDKDLSLPELKDIKKIHGLILKNRLWYLERRKQKVKSNLFYKLEKIAVLGVLKYSQQFKEAILAGGAWPCPCPAGRTIQVIYPNGDLSACEVLPPSVNLRRHGFAIKSITLNDKPCACTHICFIHSAMAACPKSVFGIISGYFKARKILKKYD